MTESIGSITQKTYKYLLATGIFLIIRRSLL